VHIINPEFANRHDEIARAYDKAHTHLEKKYTEAFWRVRVE
jgi:hypothetical protein